ncbi:MAG: hypothetical protein IT480_06585 [Gammaproteobacteria bacterium]|nr:hypothetical protein [Gammaproteobacteria bacterium]
MKAISVALCAQNVMLAALAATHPDQARLLRAFDLLAEAADAHHASDPLVSGALTAALDAYRQTLLARPIP